MSDQHTNEEEQDPIRVTDKRRIDPETGQLRDQLAHDTAEAEDAEAAAQGRALPQVEDTLSAADYGCEDAKPAQRDPATEDEAAALREDLQRLQAEFVNYRRRVERDRDVAKDNANFSMLEAMLPVLDDVDAADAAGDLEGPFAAIARKMLTT